MLTGNSLVADEQWQKNYINDALVMIGVFTKDAVQLASSYCMHSNRRSVTKKDIELALKTRAYYGENFWNRHDIQQQLNDMKQFLSEESENESENEMEDEMEDEEMEDEMESEMEDDYEDEEEINEPFVKSECMCNICTTLNGVCEKWPTWNPCDLNNISIKNSIDNIYN